MATLIHAELSDYHGAMHRYGKVLSDDADAANTLVSRWGDYYASEGYAWRADTRTGHGIVYAADGRQVGFYVVERV